MDTTAAQVCEDIFLLVEKLKYELLQLAETRGITRTQLFALYSIEQQGDVPMGQMADVLHCDASNVTGIVDRLVSQGLVMRKEYERDRRTKKLNLTDKGKAVIEEIKALLPSQLHCDRLSQNECNVLHAAIVKMCA